MEESEYFRGNVFDALRLLSSRQDQLDYIVNVPIADVRAELFETWFKGLSTDTLPPFDIELYSAAFSKKELALIEAFDVVYLEHQKKACDQTNTVSEMHENKYWVAIMDKAKETLDKINE